MASKSIIDLEKCIDKEVRVKFQGGREGARSARAPRRRRRPTRAPAVRGVLKGFDQLVNIVLDDCVESMHGAPAPRPVVAPSGASTRHRPPAPAQILTTRIGSPTKRASLASLSVEASR